MIKVDMIAILDITRVYFLKIQLGHKLTCDPLDYQNALLITCYTDQLRRHYDRKNKQQSDISRRELSKESI